MLYVPRNALELYGWIQEDLGVLLTPVSPVRAHRSPFEVVNDVFFGVACDALVLASRGSGKSLALAILALAIALFEPGVTILLFSAVEKQTQITWGYLQQLARRLAVRDYVEDNYQDRVTLHSGSRILAGSAGADSSVIAAHGQVLIVDEADTWPPERFDNALLMVGGIEEHPRRVVVASTRYSPTGLLNTLIAQNIYAVYEFDILCAMTQCPECLGEDCSLFVRRTGRGKLEPLCGGLGLGSHGFIPRESHIATLKGSSSEAFELQQLLREVQTRGRLFPSFDYDRHVKPVPEFDPRTTPAALGLDWGAFGALVLVIGLAPVLWAVEDYGGYAGQTSATLKAIILNIQGRYGRPLPVFCGRFDQLTRDRAAVWAEDDITLIPVTQGRDDRHEIVSQRLEEDTLLFSEDCGKTIAQMRQATKQQESRRKRKLATSGDDMRDALSYALAGIRLAGETGDFWPGGGVML